MNNREVAHLWANRSRESAKGSHFYFEGDTVYSYGPHFPIARLIKCPSTGRDLVLLTSRTYSQTTSKHRSFVLNACSHLPRVLVTDPAQPVHTLADLDRLRAEDAERREREEQDSRDRRNEDARRKRAQAKAITIAIAAYPSELEAWRNGGPLPAAILRGDYRTATALRLIDSGRYIETTRGAKVPAVVARKVWPMLLKAHTESGGQPQTLLLSIPEFQWGDYRGLTLREGWSGQGVYLLVGCHQIPWSELELMAERLGLIQRGAEVAS